jgi:hypothetical protein
MFFCSAFQVGQKRRQCTRRRDITVCLEQRYFTARMPAVSGQQTLGVWSRLWCFLHQDGHFTCPVREMALKHELGLMWTRFCRLRAYYQAF